jgi:hypothetical protein
VHVSYSLDSHKVVYVVRDERPGFDWAKYLNDDLLTSASSSWNISTEWDFTS